MIHPNKFLISQSQTSKKDLNKIIYLRRLHPEISRIHYQTPLFISLYLRKIQISTKLNKNLRKLHQDMVITPMPQCLQISGIAHQGLISKMWTLSISRLWIYLTKQKTSTWRNNKSYLKDSRTLPIRLTQLNTIHHLPQIIAYWTMTHWFIKFNLPQSLYFPRCYNQEPVKETHPKKENHQSLLFRMWNLTVNLRYSKRCRVKWKLFRLKVVGEVGEPRKKLRKNLRSI